MDLIVGKKYLISINFGGKILTYNCLITSFDGSFFSFTDKFGEDYTYSINLIISIKEV